MHKVNDLHPIGIIKWISLYALLSISGFLVLSVFVLDRLLFVSDIFSVSLYSSAIVAVLVVALLVLSIPLFFVSKQMRYRIYRKIMLFNGGLLLSLFISGFSLWYAPLSDKVGIFIALSIPVGIALVWFYPRRDVLISRLSQLSQVYALLWVVTLIGGLGYTHLIKPKVLSSVEAKSMVLVVLDGMPLNYLASFNPEAPKLGIDDEFQKGLLYTNVYTQRPWTNAWFNTIYRGIGDNYIKLYGRDTYNNENLISLLQANNVSTKLINYHQVGIPEAVKIVNYKGIRSIFIGSGFSWFPALLGLDYNMNIKGLGIGSLLSDRDHSLNVFLRKPIYNLLNGTDRHDNLLADVLIPEIKRTQKYSNHFFIVFHVSFNQADEGNRELRGVEAWEFEDGEQTRERQYFVSANNQYDINSPAARNYAAAQREHLATLMQIMSDKFVEFKTEFDATSDFDNISLIVTSDHGRIFDRGRAYYAFNVEEEVVRVPFVVFDSKYEPGINSNLYSTPDVAETILDEFNIDEVLSPDALSILGHNGGHEFVYSLARSSAEVDLGDNDPHEFLLSITYNGLKYRLNLAPEGEGEWSVGEFSSNFNEHIIEQGNIYQDGVPDAIHPILTEVLLGLGLESDDVNTGYQAYLG